VSFNQYPSDRTSASFDPELPGGSVLQARPKFQDRRWLHLGMLLLTLVSTTLVGAEHYAAFLSDFERAPLSLGVPQLVIRGLWYSGTILLILGAHELGHYLACRYYQVDASLPFFIPAPLLTGTLGAFIRIREPIRTKPMLFDIGAAGPFAGFVFAVPALFLGLSLSHVVRLPDEFSGPVLSLGEPLLFQAAAWLTWGSTPEGYSLNLHPMAFAAWFGLLATALNLFPVGQLDGGHIAYAVLGRRSTQLTLVAIAAAIGLTFISSSWLVWTVLMILMTLSFGPRHPRTLDEHVPLDRPRMWLAAAAAVMFALCFTHNPIEIMDLLQTGVEVDGGSQPNLGARLLSALWAS
jgi:membrane-associated protease RseP (regulator of RpoE activity)